jgi:redox-sensing transcriptional repressor
VPAKRLSDGVAARLSHYLHVLTQARKAGCESISSEELSDYTSVNPTQIRRDLSGFGKFGVRGVGYSVERLTGELRKVLGAHGRRNIAVVGAGRLGEAIVSSDVFADHGFDVAAVLDADPDRIGSPCGTLVISAMSELADVVRAHAIVVGVMAVPAEAGQEVADALVASGVRIIVNYTDALISAPAHVTVRDAGPAAELLRALYFAERA